MLETPSQAKKNQRKRRVTVHIPEPEQIGVKKPVWFPASHDNNDSIRTPRANDGSSVSGKRNLFEVFNDVDEIQIEHMSDYEQYISDDNADDSDAEDLWTGYMDLGPPSKVCQKCNAQMWNEERNNKSSKNSIPTFTMCCKDGQVKLPAEKCPPPFLTSLLSGGEKFDHFRLNIRTYNFLFQFTSIGGKIDRKINNRGGPYCFKLNGQNYHLIGSLKLKDGQPVKFCQLYVYDTENEIENRLNAVPGSEVLDPDIVEGLLKMLDENNQLAEGFRYARDRINLGETDNFSLLLVSSKSASGRKNQVGPSNEVATLVVGDSDDTCPFRDIVVQTKQMYLKRIYVTCKHFMQLQYPLLFPYDDDGFHLDIPLHSKKPKVSDENVSDLHPDETQHRTTVTMREYYAYKLMIRPEEGMNLHLGGRLWQQFTVDAFAAVEQYRLDWIRAHQNIIMSDLYKSIRINIVVKNGGQSLLGWESDGGGGEIDKQEGYTGTVEFDFVDFHESVESLQGRILGD
ncbi:hypothetical protein AgCh_019584 [Apium graveolens]